MTASGDSLQAQLQAWRERHAARIDPARRHFVEALERRAAAQQGEPRRLLDERLRDLIAADAGATALAAGEAADAAPAHPPAASALGDLLEYAASLTASGGDGGEEAAPRSRFPELAALDDFRDLWSSLHMRRQLRQSLAQTAADAGPLNSGRLVHRALTLMRQLSPGYLQQFLAYVDLLSWMEQMHGSAALPARPAAPPPPSRRARSRPAK